MKKAWILLLVVTMVGALLAVPGTALAKGKPPRPPAEQPTNCGSASFSMTLGSNVTFVCTDVPSAKAIWKVTFSGYQGKVYLITQLRNSIPGDRCVGDLALYTKASELLMSGTGSGFSFRRIEDGMYYTLDTSNTQLMDGNCTGGDGVVDWADGDSGFVFSAELQGKIKGSITIDVDFTPSS